MGKTSKKMATAATTEVAKKSEDATELSEKAQACLERYEVDQALKLFRRALKLEPDNVSILDAYGEASLQAGKRDDACKLFMRSVEIQPEGAAGRYMYLGQLLEGMDAIRCFERGVGVLRAERVAAEQCSGSRDELRQAWIESTHALATGLCSAAEIYLTDACDEADAEERCEALATEVCCSSVVDACAAAGSRYAEWHRVVSMRPAGCCTRPGESTRRFVVALLTAVSSLSSSSNLTTLSPQALALVEPLEVQTLAEPYVTAASLRLSQQRNEEADALLQKVRGWCNGSGVMGSVAEVRTVRLD